MHVIFFVHVILCFYALLAALFCMKGAIQIKRIIIIIIIIVIIIIISLRGQTGEMTDVAAGIMLIR